MKTYRVYATMTTQVYVDIEAESAWDAYEKYENTDGADFHECGSGWDYEGMVDAETNEWCSPFADEEG